MKKNILLLAAAVTALSLCGTPVESEAAGSRKIQTSETSLQRTRKAGWVKQYGNYYFYRRSGELKYGWVYYYGKRYYTDPTTGIRQTGFRTIKNKTYYFRKKNGEMLRNGLWKINGKFYYFQQNGAVYTGWKTINNKTYYFGEDGAALKGFQDLEGHRYYFRTKTKPYRVRGWMRINQKRYHFNTSDPTRPEGAMDTGLVTIREKQYYFGEDGVQIKDDFVSDGKLYSFDADGVCTVTDAPAVPPSIDGGNSSNGNTNNGAQLSDDFLFFTLWESGRGDDFYAGYNQTGGDRGNACGKYQFDYRYALLPFVQYCYSKDPVFFKPFKPYAKLSLLEKSKLQGNAKFYSAWNKIFQSNKIKFANYQDAYAKQEYYDVTERYLKNYGVDISKRPDVVKGAVFSYSIQHGQLTAANAVVSSGIKNSTSNEQFLKKLYQYRMSKFPTYINRYKDEYKEAKRRLSLVS